MSHGPVVVLGLLALIARPLSAAETLAATGPKQPFEQSSTQSLKFAPGGTIHVNSSYGFLTVEGWDEPEVRITVIKSTDSFYDPSQEKEAAQRFEQIQVATERASNRELSITTTVPVRRRALLPALKKAAHLGITVEYKILVPRDSRLVVKHDNGYVWVSDLTGDVEVRSHTGDMIVALPDPGPYSINASTRVGSVSSDFTARNKSEFFFGTHYEYPSETSSRRVFLRMGRGSITIVKGSALAPFYKD